MNECIILKHGNFLYFVKSCVALFDSHNKVGAGDGVHHIYIADFFLKCLIDLGTLFGIESCVALLPKVLYLLRSKYIVTEEAVLAEHVSVALVVAVCGVTVETEIPVAGSCVEEYLKEALCLIALNLDIYIDVLELLLNDECAVFHVYAAGICIRASVSCLQVRSPEPAF